MTASNPAEQPDAVQVFEGRIILDCQPPITDAALNAIAGRCVGPIPADLERLWRQTFGGKLDYGLSVAFGEHVHEFSFTELFYPGSDHYRDLDGWIEHEIELAEEAAGQTGAQFSGRLSYLPFGGFEYLDRLYVCVEPGPDHGAVFAFSEGLPPAWILRLHEASVARIADDIPSLFRSLDLPSDPRSVADDDYAPGAELLSAVQDIGASDPERSEALMRIVEAAIVDWRAALEAGDLVSKPRHGQLALAHASTAGDIELFERLSAMGCDLDERFGGGGGPLTHAFAHGRLDAARWLLDKGADVTDAIGAAAMTAPTELIAELLARGSVPSGLAASAAARAGNLEGAALIADALARSDLQAVRKLIDDLAYWAGRAEASAQRIEAGALISNVTAEDYRGEGGRMRALRNHCASLVGPSPKKTKPFWSR